MLPVHLALVSLAPTVALSELTIVAAAIQKQLTRDFGPIWTVDATIDAFARQEDVPLGYWSILLVDTFDEGGQHRDRKNQPFALVAAGQSWPIVASHEALEMLADPFGNRLVAGESPVDGQRVEFLVEVCDPCQADAFGYTVNGLLVSDFYTPRYFDPVPSPAVRYSFTGALTSPRQVLPGGYLTWREPTSGHWFQQHVVGPQSQVKDLGPIAPGNNSLRATIDALTPETRRLADLSPNRPSMRNALKRRVSADMSAAAQAGELKSLIDHLRWPSGPAKKD